MTSDHRYGVADLAQPSRMLTPARDGARAMPRLRNIPRADWIALADRAVEPNGYYLPDWALAVDATARGRSDLAALCAHDDQGALIAVLPVISARRALRLPLPLLVAAEAYGTLQTPLLDRDGAVDAASRLIAEALRTGAHALLLRDIPLSGAAMTAFATALARQGLKPTLLRSYQRACLDASQQAELLLKDALGGKKLKELRRQRQRLSEFGAVSFNVATTPAEVTAALETFLVLEASGWKGARGTALAQHAGDSIFIRRATAALAAKGQCLIAMVSAGSTPIAAGIVLKQQSRAFWFKLGTNPQFSKFSPGVQLAVDLTRHVCADPDISMVDSTAAAGNRLIEPIWRGRMQMGDVMIPLRAHDPWVPVIRTALRLHQAAEHSARRAIRAVRSLKTALR